MQPARPFVTPRPCPACGSEVDPLRAPRVIWLEDGPRFFCGQACKERFTLGERGFDATSKIALAPANPARPSVPDLVREATRTRESGEPSETGAQPRPRRLDSSRSLRWVAPAGLALAAVAAVLEPEAGARRWALLATGAAGLVVLIRAGLRAVAAAPVRARARELVEALPFRARVHTTAPGSYEEVRASDLRRGDAAIVLEGELAPVDGVIEEGACAALHFPRATHARPYVEGDFILGGTRVLEGAITVRALRTGDDRALRRAVGIAGRQRQDQTPASRLRFVIGRWGWAAFALAGAALLIWVGPDAAAAFLLGVPALAMVASLDAPLRAGAVAAAKRGMFFGSSRAVRDAGRARTTAILLRGALTAGEPEVQQALALGRMDLSRVLAVAAAAEHVAEDHPIAGAIRRYAAELTPVTATVRKERVHAGLGVTAVTPQGVPVVVGRRQLMLDEGISIAGADGDAAHIENEGLTPIFIAVDGALEALVAVLDPTHVGARDAVERIADLPCDVVVLSGDDRRTVERIASQLGGPRVKAPLLPSERADEVRALRDGGGITAAIGRGGEDDAVLAAADVPISLRLVGSALEDRGVVVASQDVRDAAGALWVARAVRRSTWRGVGLCAVVVAGVAAGAALGWLTPLVAALVAGIVEFWVIRGGARLLRRVDLRVPMKQ